MKSKHFFVKNCHFFTSWFDADTGELHREDGAAVISHNGRIVKYYKQGKLHRENGPALINYDGEFHYLNGVRQS